MKSSKKVPQYIHEEEVSSLRTFHLLLLVIYFLLQLYLVIYFLLQLHLQIFSPLLVYRMLFFLLHDSCTLVFLDDCENVNFYNVNFLTYFHFPALR